ncbi:hypothetical protein D3C71_1965060 [compost metagenome]
MQSHTIPLRWSMSSSRSRHYILNKLLEKNAEEKTNESIDFQSPLIPIENDQKPEKIKQTRTGMPDIF